MVLLLLYEILQSVHIVNHHHLFHNRHMYNCHNCHMSFFSVLKINITIQEIPKLRNRNYIYKFYFKFYLKDI